MPRYQYECHSCGESFEKRQSFSDDPLTDCPLCDTEGTVDRLISSVGVIFKGSGFYINDSKPEKKKPSTKDEGSKNDKDKSNGSSDTSGEKAEKSDAPAKSADADSSSKSADKETSKAKTSSSK